MSLPSHSTATAGEIELLIEHCTVLSICSEDFVHEKVTQDDLREAQRLLGSADAGALEQLLLIIVEADLAKPALNDIVTIALNAIYNVALHSSRPLHFGLDGSHLQDPFPFQVTPALHLALKIGASPEAEEQTEE
jgi:hypothetical protein